MAKKPDKFQVMLLKDLAVLGSTPDGIARTLAKKKIKGERDSGSSCPIAAYLIKEYRGTDVEVGGDTVKVNGVRVKAPRPIEQFVNRFDEGKYPKVDRNPMTKEEMENAS